VASDHRLRPAVPNCDPRSRERAPRLSAGVDVTALTSPMTFCRTGPALGGRPGRPVDSSMSPAEHAGANRPDPGDRRARVADVRAARTPAGQVPRAVVLCSRKAGRKELGRCAQGTKSSRCCRPRSNHARPGPFSKAHGGGAGEEGCTKSHATSRSGQAVHHRSLPAARPSRVAR